MRPGEQHGVDYLFVTAQQFKEWIAAGALLEYAVVYGDYKGIPLSQARLHGTFSTPCECLTGHVVYCYLCIPHSRSLVTLMSTRPTHLSKQSLGCR